MKCDCRSSCQFYEIGKRCPEGSVYTPREPEPRAIDQWNGASEPEEETSEGVAAAKLLAEAPLAEVVEPNILLMMVGLPRCGKSTAALEHGFPIVCPDSIRKALGCYPFDAEREPEVWQTAKVMVRALFASGHRVVTLDATNTTRKRRAEWVDTAWVRRFALFPVDAETAVICRERAVATDHERLIPVIDRMLAEYEPFDAAVELMEWER